MRSWLKCHIFKYLWFPCKILPLHQTSASHTSRILVDSLHRCSLLKHLLLSYIISRPLYLHPYHSVTVYLLLSPATNHVQPCYPLASPRGQPCQSKSTFYPSLQPNQCIRSSFHLFLVWLYDSILVLVSTPAWNSFLPSCQEAD